MELTKFEQKVIDLVNTLDSADQRQFFLQEVDEEYPDIITEVFSREGISVKITEQVGGEDQGREYFTVYKFSNTKNTAFVKFDGWYSSYDGCDFDEAYVVRPEQVLETIYKKV